MIISDLDHLAVVTEKTSIVGGSNRADYYKAKVNNYKHKFYKVPESAVATGTADSAAFGDFAVSNTNTSTLAVAGEFATSSSSSQAVAINN